MAIQMRRGLRADFDPYKMLPGEWAVSIDPSTSNQIVWMCFEPGVCKRMGTYEDFVEQVKEATADVKTEYVEEFDKILDEIKVLSSQVSDDKDAVVLVKTTIEDEYLPQIQEALSEIQEKVSESKNSADAAAVSAENAKKSEVNAKNSETEAKTSETNAATSESNAKISETNAATSATTAMTKATDAANYASNAETSAMTATNKAIEASQYAEEAAESAKQSQISADAAAVSEANAKTSEANAKTYAEQAKAVSGEQVALNRQTLGYSKKNLYDNIGNFVSNSYGGVTISRGENDTFNAIGTATDSLNVVQKTFSLPVGKYIISKKISSGVVIAFYNRTKNKFIIYNVSTTGTEFEITDENDILDIRLQAMPGKVYDITGQAIMIRSAEITDGTYEPYVDDVDTRLQKIDDSILNTLEEIDANTSEGNIAGALAVKEISKKMQNEMEASSNWVDITDSCNFGFVDIDSAAVYMNSTLRLVSFWVAVNGNVNNQGTVFDVALLPSGSNPKILISSCDHTTEGVSVNLLTDGGAVKSSHSMGVSIANARYSGLIAF